MEGITFPTTAARRRVAAKLGIEPPDSSDQDWEWCVASPELFEDALNVYRADSTSDLERVSLIEILLQCVADTLDDGAERLPGHWSEVEALLRERPTLQKGAIVYWSGFGSSHEYALIARAIKAIRRDLFEEG